MKKIILLTMAIFAFALCSCSETSQSDVSDNKDVPAESTDVFAMDTYMTFTAYGDNAKQALEQATDRVKKLDEMLSTGNENSEIAKLNQTGSATLSDDAAQLMSRSDEYNNKTSGVFDPAVYPLMQLWGFTDQQYKVPDEQSISQMLPLIDFSRVNYDKKSREVKFESDGMGIDFGGIAKGYTSAEIMDIFKDNDLVGGLVSLGGNVQAMGKKPDGSLWKIAVQNPDKNSGFLGILELTDKAVITSGGYERFFEQDGKVYHHILDPKTGYPAETDLQSVTIVSDDGTLADAYSTSLFVMGLDKAIDFWKENSKDFDAILYTNDDKLYVTKGIENEFSSSYEFEMIEK